jgi:hypothetical protein
MVTGTPPVPIWRALRALLAGAGTAQAARRVAQGGSK